MNTHARDLMKMCSDGQGYFSEADRLKLAAASNEISRLSQQLAAASDEIRDLSQPPDVIPLAWVQPSDGTMHDSECRYEIRCEGRHWRLVRAVTGGGGYLGDFGSLADAMDFANLHHTKRVRASLVMKVRAYQGNTTDTHSDQGGAA